MTNKAIIYSIFLLIILKITAINITDLGLYGDEAQYWLWSQTLDFGYYSKPPLLAWFLRGHTDVFGSSFVSLKVFPILVYFFILYAIFKLCRSLSINKKNSWFCAFSFIIIPAASLSSFLISTDLLLLLFWTASMIVLLRVIKRNSNYNFLLLGLCLGLAFLAKYAAVYFLLNLLLLLAIDKRTLSAFKNNFFGVLIFLSSFLLVLSPNILWNFNNGWITISHTSDNANLQNLNLSIYEPLKFLIAQIIMVGPFLFLSFVFFLKHFRLDFENKFLLVFSIPVLLIILTESFLVRANANWAAPALISIFILFFRLINYKNPHFLKINFVFNYFIAVCLFVSVLISLDNKAFNRVKGVSIFVKEINKVISDKDIVITDRIIFSNIAYEMRNQQNKVLMPHNNNSPITNHFQMSSSLKLDRKESFFLVGGLNDISYLLKEHEGKLIKKFSVSFNSSPLELYEVVFK